MDLTFESICTFPLPSDLFTLAVHDVAPVLALGLASGHVQLQRLPALPSSSSPKSKAKTPSTNGHGTIDTAWRTRRHKGSCRSLVFSPDGEELFTAGRDGIVKAAATETGRVNAKIRIPRYAHLSFLLQRLLYLRLSHRVELKDLIRSDSNGEPDPATLIYALTPQNLLVATDSSALHVFDLRTDGTFSSPKPQQTYHPHYDFVSSLTPLAPSDTSTSGYSRQWFSTGGSTTAVTDIRKGVVFESGDFEEELLSSTVFNGKGSTRIMAGGEKGFVRIWEDGVKGVINGKEKRVYIQRGESLDVMCRVPQRLVGEDMIAVGRGDGTVSFAKTNRRPGVVSSIRHDEVEGVVALGFDPDGRLITGGGNTVKVWEKNIESSSSPEIDTDEDEDEDYEGELSEVHGNLEDGDEQDDTHDETEDQSTEEDRPKRKKRKRNKGKGKKNNNNNHIMAFKGMD